MLALLLLASNLLPPADLSASGVVLGTASAASVAILRAGGQTRVVAIGDAAFGGRVTAIAWAAVSVDFGGTITEVRVRRDPSAAAVRPAPVVAAAGPAGATAHTMARDEVQRRIMQESPRLLTETALTPVTENGKVTGLALSRLPAGANLLSDAGLQPGDVLTEINGTPIDGLPALMGLWPRMQNESQVQAVVLRGGHPVTLSVTLR